MSIESYSDQLTEKQIDAIENIESQLQADDDITTHLEQLRRCGGILK